MSRKILQVGTDILTINDKLVSVTEDYPFWKVNANTSEQYYSALDRENTSVPYTINSSNLYTFSGTSMLGFVTCDGVNHYSIPNGDGHIKKFNSVTQTLSYIGSGLNTFSGAVAVGKFIYFIPSGATSVIKLDTELDTFISIGSFAGTTKWGRPILLPNGIIFAPRVSATTNFTLNTSNDNIVLVNATNITVSDTYEAGTWFYNGFIYGLRGLGSGSGRMIKINATTYAETVLPFSLGSNTNQSGCQYKNLIFIAATNFVYIFDCISDTYIGSITGTGNLSAQRSSMLAMDGWIYMFSTTLLHNNIRINPKNFTMEIISTNTNISGFQNAGIVTALNGRIYSFDGAGTPTLKLINTGVNETNNPNKKLHRLINKV